MLYLGGYIVCNLQVYDGLVGIYVRNEDLRAQASCVVRDNEVSETTETNKKAAAALNSFLE
jgi:hypothetical protein